MALHVMYCIGQPTTMVLQQNGLLLDFNNKLTLVWTSYTRTTEETACGPTFPITFTTVYNAVTACVSSGDNSTSGASHPFVHYVAASIYRLSTNQLLFKRCFKNDTYYAVIIGI